MIKEKINVKIPNILELEKILEKIMKEYDEGIKKSIKFHKELIFYGLTDAGLKEYEKETKKQRKNRIWKINKIHPRLIESLVKNKRLEKRIDIIHKKLNEKISKLRNIR